jgi:hypothetical protein
MRDCSQPALPYLRASLHQDHSPVTFGLLAVVKISKYAPYPYENTANDFNHSCTSLIEFC